MSSCSIEQVLADAQRLVSRLREHESQADVLVAHGRGLHNRIDAMNQYQEDLHQLNEVARHRPRSSLIINLLAENTQIRDLQAENRELRLALDEHQAALDMIMSKYRQQVHKLTRTSDLDRALRSPQPGAGESDKIDKIAEMAAVMKQAISLDDKSEREEHAMVAKLKFENANLRKLLNIASKSLVHGASTDAEVQTELFEETCPNKSEPDDCDESGSMNDIIDAMFDMNSSIVSIKGNSDCEADALTSDVTSDNDCDQSETNQSTNEDKEHSLSSIPVVSSLETPSTYPPKSHIDSEPALAVADDKPEPSQHSS